jgi:hypothetical protein
MHEGITPHSKSQPVGYRVDDGEVKNVKNEGRKQSGNNFVCAGGKWNETGSTRTSSRHCPNVLCP